MARNRKQNEDQVDDQVEDTDEEEQEVQGKTIVLDRVYTYEGVHYGPGEVTLRPKGANQEKVDKMYKDLRRSMKRNKEADRAAGVTNYRKDRAISTIPQNNIGTDRMMDQEDRSEYEENENEVLVKVGEDEVPASSLWNKSDEELEEMGANKKTIKKIRKAQEAESERQEEETEAGEE